MIKGFLRKFEPTEKGISVMIQCEDADMGKLVNLYKKEVAISLNVEKAEVQSSVQVQIGDIMHKFESLLDDIRRIHDEETNPGSTGELLVGLPSGEIQDGPRNQNGVKTESRQEEASSPDKGEE